ncbi:hypothetical protein QUC31_008666 [Theobroma cacao]
MEIFKKHLHKHPLWFIEKGNQKLFCTLCGERLSGSAYGCSMCKIFIHDHCSELPPSIENFLHPCPLVLNILSHDYLPCDCTFCMQPIGASSYHYEECYFDMHVQCALQPTMKSEGEKLIQHFTHWHPLKLIQNKEEDQVCCFKCQKVCSGSATAYGCEKCKFFLHDSCMISIPRKINHFFHPCPLILCTSGIFYTCGGCEDSGSFLTFSCRRCRFELDVKCAVLPTVQSGGAKQIQHPSHQHPLALLENIKGRGVRCKACGKICSGLTNTFGCRRCKVFFHKSCAVELSKELHHPFHTHSLTPSSYPQNDSCAACGLIVRSLPFYRCNECKFSLHKDCAKLKPSYEYGPHPHRLTLIDKTDGIYCDICYEKANNFCLRCVVCRFSIHLYCHPSVPTTIEHKCHIHPLTLTESPFEFELNSPEDEDEEFYCDACEKKRDKENPVYYCVSYKFIVEIGCVTSSLLSFLTNSDEQSRMSSRIISTDEENSEIDPVLAKLDEEIAKCREKAKPFELEIESLKRLIQKLQARLQELEAKLEPITWGLDKLEEDRFLYMYELKHKMKGKHSIEASP